MKSQKMYKELAVYYDMMYESKPYQDETVTIRRLIHKNKKSPGNELLDIACGTGNHIRYFRKYFKAEGLDMNNDMLKIARKKNPRTQFYQDNMISFDLKKRYDVITCLFGSIAYLRTYTNLKKTIDSFSRHLKPGGVLVIEQFVTRDKFHSGKPFLHTVDKPDIKICRMNVTRRRGITGILDFHFIIATKHGIRKTRDIHEIGLFDRSKFTKIVKNEGFKTQYLKNGLMKDRGLFVAVKSN